MIFDGWARPVTWAEEPCEPRPRAVPKVGPGLNVPPTPLPGPPVVHPDGAQDAVLPDWVLGRVSDVFFAEAAKFDAWSRGFNYEAIGEGHYPDQ